RWNKPEVEFFEERHHAAVFRSWHLLSVWFAFVVFMSPRIFWLLLVGCLLAACSDPASDTERATTATAYRNHGPEAAYVGRDVCGTCHPDKLQTFEHSQMGQAFKPASATKSIANFDDPAPIYDDERDLYYQPFRRGEALFVQEYRLADGDTAPQRTEQIHYIVGS